MGGNKGEVEETAGKGTTQETAMFNLKSFFILVCTFSEVHLSTFLRNR
jgi:hypothetical protein